MFGKLFESMYDGTLATRGPWQALVTFQQMIVLADRTGIVDMTAEALSRRTTIPLDIIKIGIAALEQEDSESRTPTENGRRIVRLSDSRAWGWQIVNYEKYRKIRSADERREYMANLMQKRRESQRAGNPPRKQVLAKLAHADAEAIGSRQSTSKPTPRAPRLNGAAFDLPDWIPKEHWDAWIEARTKLRKPPTPYAMTLAVRKLANYREQGHPPAQVLMASAMNGWTDLYPPKGQ